MSNNQAVIETLLKKRDQLLGAKEQAIMQFDADIQALESAIETFSGKKVWETPGEVLYDDTNPDYIRQSVEEI